MKSKGRIFLVDDDELIITMLTRALNKEGYDVRAEMDTEDIVNKIRSCSPHLVLLDVRLPDVSGIEILEDLMHATTAIPVVMLTADDTAVTCVQAMKLGASDYLTKPFNMDEVKMVIRNILEKSKLQEEVGYFKKIYTEEFETRFVGASPSIKSLISEVDDISTAGVSTVLITGESGTGKELMARHVHERIHLDGEAPFIRVNCAALPETLLETELFGYLKGTFTDAKADKKGLFELADGGSILLDEIGEMKPDLQSKLLRVLEERKIRRVGGKDEVPVDTTVIATTNRDLSEDVENGAFRMDLFYRLNTFNLKIPPLRDRLEDISLLARHFLSFFCTKYNRTTPKDFSSSAEEILYHYDWPGNVRELKNVIERIVVLKKTEVIQPEHLPADLSATRARKIPETTKPFELPDSGVSLEDLEKDLIRQALEKAGHNKTLAAKLLNISYDTLRYQIKKFGLE